MKHLYVLCIVLLYIFPLSAQVPEESLIEKAESVLYTSPKQAVIYADKAAKESLEQKDVEAHTRSLFIQGMAYKFLGDFDISIKTLYDALNSCPEDSHSQRANVLMQIANVYCRLKDFPKAFELNDQATTLCKIYRDSTSLAASYNNRGIIHTYLNEYKTADQCFRNALMINRKMKDLKAVAANLNNMCLYEGDIDEKLKFIHEAIVLNKNMNATWSLAENYNNMGRQYFYAKHYPPALEALKKAREIAETADAKDLICDNYEYFSWVYSAMGNYKEAYNSLLRLHELSIELQQDKRLRNVEQELSAKRLLSQQKEAELKEQAYEIEILRRNSMILLGIIGSLVVLGIFLPRWYKRRKDLQLMTTRIQLQESERKLSELRLQQQEQALSTIQGELASTRQEVTGFAMFLRSRNELLDKIREQIKEGYRMEANNIVPHLKKINAFISQYQDGNEETSAILHSIEEKNAEFMKRLLEKHPLLTQGERYLATLLRVNLSTKEISLLTGALPKTINMNRYRLRKALNLGAEEELVDYLLHI